MNNLKRPLKKLILTSFSFLTALGCMFVQPFAISARDFQQSLPSPFLGVMSYVSDTNSKILSSSGLFEVEADSDANWSGSYTGTGRCSLLEPTGVCDEYVYNINESPSSPIKISFPDLDVSGSTSFTYSSTYTITFDFIFDDYYIGSFDFKYDNITYHCYVNGNSASISLNFSYETNNANIILSTLNLAKHHTTSWNFPTESFSTVNSFAGYNFDMVDFMEADQYIYPIFEVPVNSQIDNSPVYPNSESYFIFYINYAINSSNYKNVIGFDDSFTSSFTYLGSSTGSNGTWRLAKLTLGGVSSQTRTGMTIKRNSLIIPIYFGSSQYLNVGTDFALQYGLSNELLDYIKLIAEGTINSATSAADLDDLVDDKQDIMDETFDFEDSAADDLTSNLEDIDLPSVGSLSGLATGSFNFVSTQFTNLLTTSSGSLNPFGLSVMFILSIGLALLLIGKGIFK